MTGTGPEGERNLNGSRTFAVAMVTAKQTEACATVGTVHLVRDAP